MRIFLDSGHNASGYDTGAQGNGKRTGRYISIMSKDR